MAENNNDGGCSSTGHADSEELDQAVNETLSKIKHKVLVFSGKGGVGKSTVSANLALSLARNGAKVGLLDIDFHGPTIPVLFGLQGYKSIQGRDGMLPYENGNLKVMSIPFLVGEDNSAMIWRGPMKMNIIKQLLGYVQWGELDYMIIDSPPGTGDEPLSVCQTIKDANGAILVTTPQEVAVSDVRRSISFCEKLEMPVLGVIENMSGFVCPKCGEVVDIFKSGGGRDMCQQMEVKFLGSIPLDPAIVDMADAGKLFVDAAKDSVAEKAFADILSKIEFA